MEKFIMLNDDGYKFILRKSAIVAVEENLDLGQRAVRVNVGNRTEVYLADNTLEEIIERLEE